MLDLPAQIGGEESVVLLPETELAEAELIARRVRVACQSMSCGPDGAGQCTVFIGVTHLLPEGHHEADMIRRADLTLYSLKND